MSQGAKNFVHKISGSSTTIAMINSPNTLNQIFNFGYKGTEYSSTMNIMKLYQVLFNLEVNLILKI